MNYLKRKLLRAAIIAPEIQLNEWLWKIHLYGAGLFIPGVYLYSSIMDNVVLGVSLMAIGTAVLLISASNRNGKKLCFRSI